MKLIKYDAMCTAIQACVSVDEVKDIRDKAMALEAYARQAMNTDAERKASEIRLRAERKAGKMLDDVERSAGGRPKKNSGQREPSLYDKTLDDAGVSQTQGKRWQKLANLDEEVFEEALQEKQQTTTGLIKKVNGNKSQMIPEALWLWGRLRAFERDNISGVPPEIIAGEMTEAMQRDVSRIAPAIIDYLTDLIGELS